MRGLMARGALLLAAVWVDAALALGLGDIDVRSHLDQPFQAVVPVVGATDEELDSLGVRLAGSDEFRQAGLERPDYLLNLRFTVAKLGDGKAVVKISSAVPAREPYLGILVDAEWSGGRLSRSYTVFLDPPGAETAAAPASAPVPAAEPAAVPAPAPAPAPIIARKPLRHRSAARARPPVAGATEYAAAPMTADTYGPVQPNDTLWSIANRVRGQHKVEIPQVLLALYEKNRAAFAGGLGKLMRGVRLQLPTLDEMTAVDPSTAAERVAALGGPRMPGLPAPARPAENTASTSPATGAVAEPTAAPAVASLETPPPSAKESVAAGPPAGSSAISATGPAPSATAPPSPSAGVAAPAAAGIGAATASPAAVAPASGAAPAGPPTAAPTPDATASNAPAAAAPGPTAVVPPKPPRPAPAPAAESPSPPLPTLLGAAAVLIALIGWLVWRRRRRAEADVDVAPAAPAGFQVRPLIEATAPRGLDPMPAQVPAAAQPAPAVPLAPAAADEPAPVAADPEITRFAPHPDFEPAASTPVDPLSVAAASDPLTDADFHLSYGLNDEAIGILRSALAKEPARLDLKRKLAEAYFAARKPLEFEELAEDLRGHLPRDDWQSLLDMGRKLAPDAALFKAAPSPSPASTPAAPSPVPPRLEPEPLPAFDLSEFDLAEEPAPPARATGPAVVAAGLDAGHFDLAKADDGKPEMIEFKLDELDLAHEPGEAPVFEEGDEADTKLDLARAYADMGDAEAARNLLAEVIGSGNDKQKAEAQALHDRLAG